MTLLRQIFRIFGLILATLVLAPSQAIAKPFFTTDRHRIARMWHRVCTRILGIHTRVIGQKAHGPVLTLANHVSHLDISVLGGVFETRFVSKQEVKSWPVFGTLAGLQDTIFIDRAPKPSSIRAARDAVQKAVNKRARLVIFPEGTNTIGNIVLPFRRALLDNVEAPGYRVQPVAIKVAAVNGKPVETVAEYETYGWGDIGFAPHLWRVLGTKRIDVDIHFLPPISVNNIVTADIVKQAEDAVRAVVTPQ